MILSEIQEVVRECGQLMLRADHAHAGVENKGKYNDLVTRYDKAIQDILQKRLLDIAPDAHFSVKKRMCTNPLQKDAHLS